jgi:hypothetical protein
MHKLTSGLHSLGISNSLSELGNAQAPNGNKEAELDGSDGQLEEYNIRMKLQSIYKIFYMYMYMNDSQTDEFNLVHDLLSNRVAYSYGIPFVHNHSQTSVGLIPLCISSAVEQITVSGPARG